MAVIPIRILRTSATYQYPLEQTFKDLKLMELGLKARQQVARELVAERIEEYELGTHERDQQKIERRADIIKIGRAMLGPSTIGEKDLCHEVNK